MKRHILFLAAIALFCIPPDLARAAATVSCTQHYSCDGKTIKGTRGTSVNCENYTETCYPLNTSDLSQGYYKVINCTSCKGSYTKQTHSSTTEPICPNITTTSCDYCTCSCQTTWTTSGANTGYERRTHNGSSACDCSGSTAKCTVTTMEYRCAAGYYGTANSTGTSGCTRCPAATNVFTNSAKTTKAQGTTNDGGRELLSSCYLAPGTYYDNTGTFMIPSGKTCPY
ncbi:hypothetical protein HDR61_03640 [bacterium]|nr:hypothetical protein [bacterium]